MLTVGLPFDVEWLAGGCVMRKNLVLEDFYPFAGKAFYEDMIHSWHLTRRGIALKMDAGAMCWTAVESPMEQGHLDYVKYLAANYRRRRYAMRLYSLWSPRTYLFYAVNYLSYLGKKVKGLAAGRAENRH